MKMSRRQFTAIATSAAAAQAVSRIGFASAAVGSSDLTGLTLSDAAARVRAGAVTATELTEASLARIAIFDPKLDAFITVMKTPGARAGAQLDAEQKSGKLRGPLHGVPIAIKDIIDTAGARTTGGSALFEDRVPEEDATVVARLKSAGAVIIGKTNTQEFAMGGGETSFWGPSRNPWNLAHNTGGSSSGSGAAVAAFLSYGALGTDTGGSVRMPASYCGIVGLKATYGLVPIRGIMPLTLSLDHCGPMTRTVQDTALMLNAMAGYDKLDITSVEHAKEDYVAQLVATCCGPQAWHARELFRRARSRGGGGCRSRSNPTREADARSEGSEPSRSDASRQPGHDGRDACVARGIFQASSREIHVARAPAPPDRWPIRIEGDGLHPHEMGDRAVAAKSGRCVHRFRPGRSAYAENSAATAR